MAGHTNFHSCLASQLSASASRLKANIDSVIEKYDRHFEDDDLISLASMSVSKVSTQGTLKKIRDSHLFGTSGLKSTKRKDELLKLKLGWKDTAVDLNVSRAIERECVVALANVDKAAANEPSDAETLSSFDEEEGGSGSEGQELGSWGEISCEDQNVSADSEEFSGDGQLIHGDVQSQEPSFVVEDGSISFSESFNSSGLLTEECNAKQDQNKALKSASVTICISSDSDDSNDDNCGDEVQSQELSFVVEDGSISSSESFNSSGLLTEGCNVKQDQNKALKSASVTICISSDDSNDDNCGDEVDGTVVHRGNNQTQGIQGSINEVLNTTYVLRSLRPESQCLQADRRKRSDDETTGSSYVTISSPRPKVPHSVQNSKQQSNGSVFRPGETELEDTKRNKTVLIESSPRLLSKSGTSLAVQDDKETHVSSGNVIKNDTLFKSPQGIKVRRVKPTPLVPTSHSSGNVIKNDTLFKSPQGIKLRRVKPTPLVPTSHSNVVGQTRHSSNSSGFSSGSSQGHADGHPHLRTENLRPSLNVQHLHHDFRRPLPQVPHKMKTCQDFYTNSAQSKANLVDRWVDMVNMNSTTVKGPIHYPSCPPKVPTFFSSEIVLDRFRSSQKLCSQSPPSDNHKNVGVQTTLNCTISCDNRLPLPQRKMKDASTLLSNSFLDAHSPRCVLSNSSKKSPSKMEKLETYSPRRLPPNPSEKSPNKREKISLVNDTNNIMFPEEYVYKFSPLNPNRIDSDCSANVHQNQCLQLDLKCFRPRRNGKRAWDEESPNNLSLCSQSSKFRKLDDLDEPLTDNFRSQNDTFAKPSSFNQDDDGTYVIHAPDTIPRSCRECSVCNHKHKVGIIQRFSDKRNHMSHVSGNRARLENKFRNSPLHQSGQSCRASTPLRSDDLQIESEACDFISSTFSDIGEENGCHGCNAQWMSPKLDVFLNASKSNRRNCYFQHRANVDQDSLDDSFNSFSSSYLAKERIVYAGSSKQPTLRNNFRCLSTGCDRITDKAMNNSPVESSRRNPRGQNPGRRLSRSGLNVNNRNRTAHTSPPSCHRDYSSEQLDDEEAGAGSFLQARTCKTRLMRVPTPTHFEGGSCTSKKKGTNNCNFPQTNLFKSKVSESKLRGDDSCNMQVRTEPYRYGEVPSDHFSESRKLSVDDTLSTIQGSDDEDIAEDLDFDYVDDHSSFKSHATNRIMRKGKESINEQISVKASKTIQRPSRENDVNRLCWSSSKSIIGTGSSSSNNSKEKAVQDGFVVESGQSESDAHRRRASHQRGWKSSVWEYIAKQDGHATQSELFRSSTPVRQSYATPSWSMNASISTIVSHQDKEVDGDDSDDDWETKTIGDVDIL